MLTRRQKDILLSLMKSDEPVTAEWIAKELDVSDRTVRTDVRDMKSECPLYGISIISYRGKGYKLQINNHRLFEQQFHSNDETIERNQIDYSQEHVRVMYMLKRLLLEKEPIKLEDFEDELFVSKPKVQHDLNIVRKILGRYQLQLVTRPHYGTSIQGEEYMRRLCLSNYVLNSNYPMSTEKAAFWGLDETLCSKIKEIIIKKVNDCKIGISDISLETLVIHIAIALKRIEEGFVVESLEDSLTSKHPLEKALAKDIINDVEAYTGLSFPKSEMEYLVLHLLGTKLLTKGSSAYAREYDEPERIVQCMLERLNTELNWDFRDDNEFIEALMLHIRPAINRLRFKMNIRNPLLNEIKVKYPAAFEGAALASQCIEERLSLEVGEHEIAYIALHLGVALEKMRARQKTLKRVIVVCASGLGSAKLLQYRLQNEFRDEMEIVDSTSYHELAMYDLSSVDLIISTIPIVEELGVPVQVVNTLLENADINNIRTVISFSRADKEPGYLDVSRVFVHQDLGDKEAVIRFMCDELRKQGLVSKDYVQSVLEREALAPTNFGNLVAIPHSLVPETEKTFWTVCTLKRPIEWHHKRMVQFVCLLNVKKGPKGNLHQMYQKLIQVLEDAVTVKRIIKSDSPREIIKLLS